MMSPGTAVEIPVILPAVASSKSDKQNLGASYTQAFFNPVSIFFICILEQYESLILTSLLPVPIGNP